MGFGHLVIFTFRAKNAYFDCIIDLIQTKHADKNNVDFQIWSLDRPRNNQCSAFFSKLGNVTVLTELKVLFKNIKLQIHM